MLGSVLDEKTAQSFKQPTFAVFYLTSTPQRLVVEAMRVEEFPPPPAKLRLMGRLGGAGYSRPIGDVEYQSVTTQLVHRLSALPSPAFGCATMFEAVCLQLLG